MEIISTIQELREKIKNWKKQGFCIGLVPTMGFLHAGHASLMKKAHEENDKVIVSVFVNPTQFGVNEDLSSYPRDIEHDRSLCEQEGVALIFHPDVKEMYGDGFCSFVNMDILPNELCGLSRPVHFKGVCTVVSKLLNIVQPHNAYFGQKDAQQLAIIRRMVQDLNFDTTIVGCPIMRETDGLALSSRNIYLTPEERKAALVLNQAVALGKKMVAAGETSAERVLSAMRSHITSEPLAKIDYLKAVNGLTMQQVDTISAPTLVAMAVCFPHARLIDNFLVE